MTVYVFAEKAVLWISALDSLARMAIALNRRSVLDKSSIKTSWASLPAKQAVTVCSSSGFNVKLLHDWSTFDLPKRTPEEHICLMPAWQSLIKYTPGYKSISYSLRLSQSKICGRQRPQKWKKGGVLIAGVPYPLSPIPLSFSLSPYPLSTPATQVRWIRKRKAIQTLGNAVTSKLLVPSWRLFPQLHPCFSKIWNWTFKVCFLRILVKI